MPICQNCDSHVSDQYARVFTPTGIDEPLVCPNCEDKTRGRGGPRDKRT